MASTASPLGSSTNRVIPVYLYQQDNLDMHSYNLLCNNMKNHVLGVNVTVLSKLGDCKMK